MERKRQFQIQTLNAKINTYEKSLNELLEKRNAIINTLTSNGTINTNTNTNLNLNPLLLDKANIQKQITETKNLISTYKFNITNIANQLRLLPSQLQTGIENEITIYNDELTNINNIISETTHQYQENLNNANYNKELLLSDITTLNNEINNQNNVITELQANAHNSRKSIIKELHQNKQEKKALLQRIDTINSSTTIYNNHITLLTNINNILEELKSAIITYHYNLNSNNTDNTDNSNNSNNSSAIIKQITLLNNTIYLPDNTGLQNAINILDNLNPIFLSENLEKLITNLNNPDTPEYINNLIADVDNTISTNTNRINIITTKTEKANIKNSVIINNIKSNTKPISRNKTISFKDQYKQEKLIRTNLQSKLLDLQSLYNNYTSLVLDKITNEYNNAILELENHKMRTVERLNIMKDRLQNEFDTNKNNLEAQTTSIQNNLSTHNNTLQTLIAELATIDNNISNIDKNGQELQMLDNQIKQLEITIEKVKKDKAVISGN